MFSEHKLDIKLKNSNEFLIRNKLKQQFLETLKPLLFLKKILILSPFHLANNFITPNLKTYNIVSFLVNLAYGVFYVCFFYSEKINMSIVFYAYHGSMCLEHVILCYLVIKSELLVKTILTIQDIDEALQTNIEKSFRKNKKNVFNLCVYVVFCHVSTAFINMTLISPGNWMYFMPIITRFFLDLDLIFFISLMDFFTSILKTICFKIQTMSENEIVMKNLYLKFTLVLNVYKMIGDLYRIPVK